MIVPDSWHKASRMFGSWYENNKEMPHLRLLANECEVLCVMQSINPISDKEWDIQCKKNI